MQKVFIVHGWVYTTEKWSACVEALRGRGFEPVILNVPGLTALSSEVWSLSKYADWLAEQIRNEAPAIVVAHSNGGRISIACAAAHPELFKSLVLIGSAGVKHNDVGIRLRRFVAMVFARLAKPLVRSESLRARLYRLIGAPDYGNANAQMRQTMAELVRHDLVPLLPKLTMPVSLIWGAKDTLTPLADGEKMKALLPNATLTVLKDTGHSPFATHPEKIAELIASAATQ